MKKLKKGARVYVQFGSKREAAILLDYADSPNGDYQQCKVELLKENPLSPGQLLRNVYPKPVQDYKLTKRYILLRGEENMQADIVMNRSEAEPIRLALQAMHGEVDESEVQRIVAESEVPE
jgi:hypothetical protein